MMLLMLLLQLRIDPFVANDVPKGIASLIRVVFVSSIFMSAVAVVL